MDRPAISFDNVSFAYSAGPTAHEYSEGSTRQALTEATFSLAQGELVAIMGNNGSGKSTLAMLLCAIFQPDSGHVRILGKDTLECSPFDIRRHIGFVMQNPDDQLVASIVENEVAFGPENLGLPADECRRRMVRALSDVGLAGYEKREVNSLSGGQKQRVAIAGALAMEPSILLMDEAASMLDEPSRHDLADLARKLADSGTAVLMITHSIEDALMSDRVLALKDGRIVIDDAPVGAFADNRLQHELGWPTEPFARSGMPNMRTEKDASPEPETSRSESVPLIELHAVSFSYSSGDEERRRCRSRSTRKARRTSDHDGACTSSGSIAASASVEAHEAPAAEMNDADEIPRPILQGIDLAVHSGDLLAITGPTGSGKSTILQLMNGLLEPSSGEVLIHGEPSSTKRSAHSAREQVGLVFQYPEHQMFMSSVYDEVAYGPRNQGLSESDADARVREALAAVELPFDAFAMRNPFTLSGGEQRRVAIASVLSMRPAILALDEPCAGLDPAMHRHFLELLCRLHDAGQTIVLVSHEMADVSAIATRIFEL